MYLLFAGVSYYARGGANDFICKFKTLEDAISYGKDLINSYYPEERLEDYDWFNVLDTEQLEKVYQEGFIQT